MSSLPAFKHDIFISYAHLDNELLEAKQGWIDLLHQRLQVKLGQLLGKPGPLIWRDQKLRGNDVFDKILLEEVRGAALILSVLSPNYLTSTWCQDEVNTFYQHALVNGGITVEDAERRHKSRIIKLVKTRIKRANLPPFLDEVLGYEFFEQEPGSGRFYEFSTEAGEERDKRYWRKLDDLAQDIAETLELLRAPTRTTATGQTIYLAQTISALTEERDRLRRELQQHGHRVLPNRPLAMTRQWRAEVSDYLAECTLAVHLIGHDYAASPEGEARSIDELQYELALEKSKAGALAQLIWLQPGLKLAELEARQWLFLDQLLNRSDFGKQTELLQDKLEDLKTLIHTRLKPPPPPPALPPMKQTAASDANAGAPPKVYLVCDQQDYDSARQFEDYLLDQGLNPFIASGELDTSKHEGYLRMCDAVLVYGGQAEENWLRKLRGDLVKLPALNRAKPLMAQAFYLGPPATPFKQGFKAPGSLIIRNFEAAPSAELTLFLQQIAQAQGGKV